MKVKKVQVKKDSKKKKKSFGEKLRKIKNWNWKRVVTWTPRILAILYIIFITIFSFDESVFTLPWFVHLMPTLILTLIVIFTWRKPLSAAIIFLILGFGFTLIFHTYTNWLIFLIISLPLILIGILFLLEKLFIKKKDNLHKQKRKERKEKLMNKQNKIKKLKKRK
jgi:hypothetical protein